MPWARDLRRGNQPPARRGAGERLTLALYAYGTNCGIRSVISGAHGHSEEEIRYVRRRYLTPDVARSIAIEIANATFAARDRGIRGQVDRIAGEGHDHR